jgi:hypothetical protein
MEIRFSKKKEGLHIISCKRKDGTETWMHSSSFFITHDLCHYAVETLLDMRTAFFGMLASGTDINDFELPKEQRGFLLSKEALQAEHLVNLLTIEYNQGRVDDFLHQLIQGSRGEVEYYFIQRLQNGKLDVIRNYFASLMLQWNLMEQEKTMTLLFKE